MQFSFVTIVLLAASAVAAPADNLQTRQIGSIGCNISRAKIVGDLSNAGKAIEAMQAAADPSDQQAQAAISQCQQGLDTANNGIKNIAKTIITGGNAKAEDRDAVLNGLNQMMAALGELTGNGGGQGANVGGNAGGQQQNNNNQNDNNQNDNNQNDNNQNAGNQNGGNQNGGNQNGGNQKGGNQKGGNQNGGAQNGGNQKGGNQNGGAQNGGNQNGNFKRQTQNQNLASEASKCTDIVNSALKNGGDVVTKCAAGGGAAAGGSAAGGGGGSGLGGLLGGLAGGGAGGSGGGLGGLLGGLTSIF